MQFASGFAHFPGSGGGDVPVRSCLSTPSRGTFRIETSNVQESEADVSDAAPWESVPRMENRNDTVLNQTKFNT
jgi:hypothetical protein